MWYYEARSHSLKEHTGNENVRFVLSIDGSLL